MNELISQELEVHWYNVVLICLTYHRTNTVSFVYLQMFKTYILNKCLILKLIN